MVARTIPTPLKRPTPVPDAVVEAPKVIIPPKVKRTSTGPTVTWLGEDHLHGDGGGPRYNTWCGVRFEMGKPVAVSDLPVAVRDFILKKALPPFWKKVEPDGNDNPA
jgi:hypothetical protein